MPSEMSQTRLDKWLWAARFFKTRGLATDAATGGKVQVNGGRAKPARPIRIGDEVIVRRGPSTLTVTVRALSDRRGPASEAVLLYEETESSRAAREEARKARAEALPAPKIDYGGRPTKRDRRASIRSRRT